LVLVVATFNPTPDNFLLWSQAYLATQMPRLVFLGPLIEG